MEYFILRQDKSLTGAIVPTGIATQKNITEFDEVTTVLLAEQNQEECVDVLEKPRMIVSDKLKKILSEYNQELIFKTLMFEDRDEMYWLMEAPAIDCLSSACEFKNDGRLKRLVLNSEKASDNFVFSLTGILEKYLIVNLEVAEKILREDPWGILLQKVDTE